MPEPGLARAFWTVGRERGELRSEALAPVGPDQLLVQALYSAISRGSETLVLRGEVPTEEHARMRAPHQTGEFPWPVKYGYSNVGRVIEGPSEWKNRVVFEADRVFHASGQAGGLQTALQLAGDEATVVELSWYGKRHVEVPLGGAFHSRRLRLISSQVGRLPAERRTRWTPRRRLALALQLLAEDRLDALFGAEVPFEGLPRVMKTLVRPDDSTLCQRVKYAGAE